MIRFRVVREFGAAAARRFDDNIYVAILCKRWQIDQTRHDNDPIYYCRECRGIPDNGELTGKGNRYPSVIFRLVKASNLWGL